MSNDSMNTPMPAEDEPSAAIFIQMLLQLSSLATMLLGKAPHPDSGKTMKDLDAARMVIDQLDMLERKTKGNLSRTEAQVLRTALTDLRLAYVEATNESAAPSTPAAEPTSAPETDPPAAPAEESKVKFSKKY